jgi:2-hydroxychromene-2-carboxylate isomerase
VSPFARLARRSLPRAVVLASRSDLRGHAAGAFRREGVVELYFAFDDPCSAFSVIDLSERLATRRVRPELRPVVRRGIPDDPAVADKRVYALTDAARLGARRELVLGRTEPIAAEVVAPFAAWVADAPQGLPLERFCVEAMRRLWYSGDGPLPLDHLARRWRELGLGEPGGDDAAVRSNERRMARRGPYDTPAAWVHGQWFFAQDRGPQICERLDALGFGAR